MIDWSHWVNGSEYVSFEESLSCVSNCALSARERCRQLRGYPLELLRLIQAGIAGIGRIGNTRIFNVGKCCGASRRKEKLIVDPIKEEMKLALRQPAQTKENSTDGPDQTLGDVFDIGHKLGEGGFASVYSATRRSDNELVALKRILKDEVQDWVEESDGNRYPLEVSLTSKVKSIAGVPALLDLFVTPTTFILVLEQPPTPAMNLEDYIQKRTSDLSEDELRGILRQVTKIVADVHEAGVSHQDIRAANILIEVKNGRVHLIDFGGGIEVKATKEDKFSGSWFTRKSKQIFACALQKADRSNVYAIGVLAYRLMTKDCPLMSRVKGKVNIHFPEHFSPDLKNFLNECLTKEPKDSPTTKQLSIIPWLTPQVSIKRSRRFFNIIFPERTQKTICEMAGLFQGWIKSKYSSAPKPRPKFFIGDDEEESEEVKSSKESSKKSSERSSATQSEKSKRKSERTSEKPFTDFFGAGGTLESFAVYILDEKNQYERFRR